MPSRRAIAAAVAALCVGLAGVGVIATAAAALSNPQPGVVTTADGRTLEGEITDDGGDTISVAVNGVSQTVNRDNIASIDYSTFESRFNDRMGAFGPQDVAGRVALARDALGRGQYEMAMRAVDAALAIDPLDRDARRMSITITQQMSLDQASARAKAAQSQPATAPGDANVAEGVPNDGILRSSDARGLDPAQINRLRQLELQANDNDVRIRFDNNVRKRFADSQAGIDIRAFIRRDETDQALQILTRGTRDMLADVEIGSDPAAIQVYGRRINRAIVQGCATSGCHGGDNAGNFRLIASPLNAQTMITNYYLLVTYQRQPTPAEARNAPLDAGSPFAGGAMDMVLRRQGERSLLYQYILPRQQAFAKHPPVRGWDGIVRNANDRLARDVLEWMNLDMGPSRPDYHDVQFSLNPPATQPELPPLPATMPAGDRGNDRGGAR